MKPTMPFVFRQGDLPKLDLNIDRGTDFKAWKKAHFSLSRLDSQPNAKQVQALTLCFSRETVTIVDNLGLTAEQRLKATEIIAAIERYVQGQINEYQIIAGLVDGDIVEDLLKENNLSLDSAMSKCRAHEAARRQRAEITCGQSEAAIQALRKPRHTPSGNHTTKQTCPGCGSAFHPGGWKQCPAFHLVCHTCNRVGHLAKVCKSRKPAAPSPAHQAVAPATNAVRASITPSLRSFTVNGLRFEPAPTIKAHLSTPNGSALLTALPDSGADVSVAGLNVIKQLGDHKNNRLPSPVTPRTVSGHRMYPIGKLPV